MVGTPAKRFLMKVGAVSRMSGLVRRKSTIVREITTQQAISANVPIAKAVVYEVK